MKSPLFFLLCFFCPCVSSMKYLENARAQVRTGTKDLLNLRLRSDQLINLYRNRMLKMAPGVDPSGLGNSLGDVLFSYVTFDPFSRRKGKEIDEKTFRKTSFLTIDVIETATNRDSVVKAANQMVDLIDGYVKTSRNFESQSLADLNKRIQDKIHGKVNLSSDTSAALKYVQNYIVELKLLQKIFYLELLDVQRDAINGIEMLTISLIMSSLQPDFKDSLREELKSRVGVLSQLIWSLYHYEKFETSTSEKRNDDFLDYVYKCKKEFDLNKIGMMLDEGNGFFDLLRFQIDLKSKLHAAKIRQNSVW